MLDVSKYAMKKEDGFWMYADPAKVEAWKKAKASSFSSKSTSVPSVPVVEKKERAVLFAEEKKKEEGESVPVIRQPDVLHMPTEKEALALFDKLDDNRNEKLSVAELRDIRDHFFKNLKHAPTIMKAHWVADNDQNGFVERSEFEAFLRYAVYYNNYWDKFTKDGKHHVNVLGRANFIAIAKDLDVLDADKAFDMMDANASGGLSYEEFCGWMAKHTCQWKVTSFQPISYGRPVRHYSPKK